MPIIRIAWEGKGVGREADDVIDTPDKLSFQCSWQGKQSEFSYHILTTHILEFFFLPFTKHFYLNMVSGFSQPTCE